MVALGSEIATKGERAAVRSSAQDNKSNKKKTRSQQVFISTHVSENRGEMIVFLLSGYEYIVVPKGRL
jgi:hypothetical protein